MLYFNWVTQFGTSRIDTAIDIALDANGNYFIAGDTQGSLLEGANQGDFDVWLAKYSEDTEGQPQEDWRKQIGTSGIDQTKGIFTGSNGDLYLTGNTYGNLGGTNAGGSDVWLARYNTNGDQVWLLQPTGTNTVNSSNDDKSNDIFVDAQGNIYLTGTRNTTNGDTNIWVAKYTPNGTSAPSQQWLTTLESSSNDVANSVTVDSDGNVYITGYTEGALPDNTSQGSLDAFVAKYNTNGEKDWVKQFGTEKREEIRDIVVDSSDNVYLVGYSDGSLAGSNAGKWDSILVKYDTNGNEIWKTQKDISSSSNDDAFAVAINDVGNIFVTGRTVGIISDEDKLDFVGEVDDIWVAEYLPSGEIVKNAEDQKSIRQYGSNSTDIPQAIAIKADTPDSEGVVNYNVLVAGSTYGSLSTDLKNSGLSDSFFIKYTTEDQGVELPTEGDITLGAAKISFSQDKYKVSPTEVFSVPIRIEDAIGVRSIDFEIDFARSFFSYNQPEDPQTQLGALLQANGPANLLTNWTINVYPTDKGIKVNLFNNVEDIPPPQDGGEPLPQPEDQDKLDGVFAILNFTVFGDEAAITPPNAEPSPFTLTNVLVNEEPRNNSTTNMAIVPDLLQVVNTSETNVMEANAVFANGVDIQLSRSIDLDVLNLYSRQIGDTEFFETTKDVRVTSSNGQDIEGSLVWDKATDLLTFVKSGNSFTPGTYNLFLDGTTAVTFDAEGNPITGGLISPLGKPLDGDIRDDQPSGDFVGTFVVPNYNRIFTIDEITRGPGQLLEIPDEQGITTPLALSINNIRGLTKVEFSLTYNADVLDQEKLNLVLDDSLLQAGWELSQVKTTDKDLGKVNVTLTGTTPLNFTGETDLLKIDATVRNDAPYGVTNLLDLESIVLNDGDVTGNFGVHKGLHQVNYLGDANGFYVDNSEQKIWYDSGDAAQIALVGVGALTGFPQFPLIEPKLIGDITGTQGITAFDAALLASEASRLKDEPLIPNIPGFEFITPETPVV